MCGIAAFLTGPAGDGERQVQLMTDAVRHRGPDDAGLIVLNGQEVPATLGHRRLSILDLSSAGHQPMRSRDGRFWIAFNGEIYNYLELRAELEASQGPFESKSDTEVILAAYAEWGEACVERFIGMWAFVLVDVRARKAFVSRDRFGIKPLYYAVWNGGLAFASEMKALLQLPGFPRRVQPQRLYDYLVLGMTDREGATMFEGILQVPPAHSAIVSLDGPAKLEPRRYWSVDEAKRSNDSFATATEQVRHLFLENVRLHLRSDVPVGAALSGGIDSSSIVMAVRHLEGRNVDLHAFGYAAGGAEIDEEKWIDLVGREAGAIVHKVRPGASDLAADLDELIRVQDEPFGSTSIYAQHRVFRAAKEAGIKVMLDGQGADELFAGYRHHIGSLLASQFLRGSWVDMTKLLRKASKLPGAKLGDYAGWMGQTLLPPAVQRLVRPLTGKSLTPDWLRTQWFAERGVQLRPIKAYRGGDPFRKHLLQAFGDVTLPHLLRYEDRNSMAHSIESRVPFLTSQLAEYVFSLPPEYLIAPDGTTKAVLRSAMRGIVPDAVLDRRDKIGFATPEKQWLTALSGWVESILDSDAAGRISALNRDALRADWAERIAGRKRWDWTSWRWINVIRWADRYQVEC